MNKTYLIFIFICTQSVAQSNILKDNGTWFTLSNTFTLSKKFSITHTAQMRRVDFLKNTQSLILNPGLEYSITNNLSAGIGYLNFTFYPEGVSHFPIKKGEHRIMEQLTLKTTVNKLKFKQRIILEQRHLDHLDLNEANKYEINGVDYMNRLRYSVDCTIPLATINDTKLLGKVSEEIRIRSLRGFTNPDFDQSNFAVLLGVELVENSKIWVGYGRYYFKSNATNYISNNILHINLLYDVDLTTKSKT